MSGQDLRAQADMMRAHPLGATSNRLKWNMYEETYECLGFVVPEPIQVTVTTMAGDSIAVECFEKTSIAALKLKRFQPAAFSAQP